MKAIREQFLLRRIRLNGDSDAFAEIYDLYVSELLHFVSHRVSTVDYADEIVSEVFIALWKRLQTDKVKHVRGLLYRIARNKIVDYYRKKERDRSVLLDEEHLEIADSRDFRKIVGVDMEIAQVLEAFERLSCDYRDLLVMKYIDELSVKEIAEALQKTSNAVRIGIHRALSALRTDLKKKYEDKKD